MARNYRPGFLTNFSRTDLRHALWLLRRERARPYESNPAAAQFDSHATEGSVRAEYRRRGWKLPRPTRDERP